MISLGSAKEDMAGSFIRSAAVPSEVTEGTVRSSNTTNHSALSSTKTEQLKRQERRVRRIVRGLDELLQGQAHYFDNMLKEFENEGESVENAWRNVNSWITAYARQIRRLNDFETDKIVVAVELKIKGYMRYQEPLQPEGSPTDCVDPV
jgi:hypothetical protein